MLMKASSKSGHIHAQGYTMPFRYATSARLTYEMANEQHQMTERMVMEDHKIHRLGFMISSLHALLRDNYNPYLYIGDFS